MIAGAFVVIVGCFLPWLTVEGDSFNGFAEDDSGDSNDGVVFLVLAVAVLGFGITTLVAKRLLPIAILTVVFASFILLGSIADLSEVSDAMDVGERFDLDISIGAGLPIILVGSGGALAGGIVALATRRR